jgi:FkbM family methyltransferase
VQLNNALDVHVISNKGIYDKRMPFIFDLLSPQSTVIDIGSNKGYWTLVLAHFFDTCYSIEADPVNFYGLLRNLDLNPSLAPKVIPLNSAATNFDGEVILNVRRSIDGDGNLNTGLSSLVMKTLGQRSCSVNALRIDTLLMTLSSPISFIKIDCEGAESEVLKGASTTIQMYLPIIFRETAFSLDIGAENSNVSFCWLFLSDLGYAHFIVSDKGEFRVMDVFSEIKSLGYDTDVVSVHKEKIPQLDHTNGVFRRI